MGKLNFARIFMKDVHVFLILSRTNFKTEQEVTVSALSELFFPEFFLFHALNSVLEVMVLIARVFLLLEIKLVVVLSFTVIFLIFNKITNNLNDTREIYRAIDNQ